MCFKCGDSQGPQIPGSGDPGHPYRPLFKCGCALLTGRGLGGHLPSFFYSRPVSTFFGPKKCPKTRIPGFRVPKTPVFGCFQGFWRVLQGFPRIPRIWPDSRFPDDFQRFQELPKAPDLTFLSRIPDFPCDSKVTLFFDRFYDFRCLSGFCSYDLILAIVPRGF